jgi:hypothetical protein
MKSEKSHSQSSRPSSDKPQFTGCVELIPPLPTFIEFITARRLWGIPIRQLEFFVLGSNPESDGKKTSPTDILVLVFETRLAFLFGWRLEQMLDPLMQGRVKRVHAEKFLGTLMIGEPWVSEIVIVPRFTTIPL